MTVTTAPWCTRQRQHVGDDWTAASARRRVLAGLVAAIGPLALAVYLLVSPDSDLYALFVVAAYLIQPALQIGYMAAMVVVLPLMLASDGDLAINLAAGIALMLPLVQWAALARLVLLPRTARPRPSPGAETSPPEP